MTNHPVVPGIGFSDDEDKIDNRLERKESVEQLKEHQSVSDSNHKMWRGWWDDEDKVAEIVRFKSPEEICGTWCDWRQTAGPRRDKERRAAREREREREWTVGHETGADRELSWDNGVRAGTTKHLGRDFTPTSDTRYRIKLCILGLDRVKPKIKYWSCS